VKLSLVLVKSDGSRQEIPVSRSPRTIGRDPQCDIRVPAAAVSRRHCEISFDDDEDWVKIKDLGSSNGTYVNGQRITQETELTPGDAIRIGPFVLVVRFDGFPKTIDTAQVFAQAGAGATAATPATGRTAAAADDPSTRVGGVSAKKTDDSGEFDFDLDLDDTDQGDQPKL
jgi:pSer/pThr/pTyr-binding forkhead associated (FHA) protein